MSSDLTNLLPEHKRRAFMREYFLRLGTVALVLLSIVVMLGITMLIPSYFAFTQELKLKEMELARIATALESAQEKAVGDRLTELAADATRVKRLAALPSASAAVRSVLSVPRPGVTISHIAFTPAVSGGHTMTLSGTAATRAALQNYDRALGALPFVASRDLPISTYAKEFDLEFIITLTGSLTP